MPVLFLTDCTVTTRSSSRLHYDFRSIQGSAETLLGGQKLNPPGGADPLHVCLLTVWCLVYRSAFPSHLQLVFIDKSNSSTGYLYVQLTL